MTYEEEHGFEVFGQNLWMAATEREKEGEALKNDKARRAFVDDEENWETIHEMPGARIMRLSYKSASWYKFEVWQTANEWDKSTKKLVEKTRWRELRIFTMNETTHAYDEQVSTKQIADKIKEIDKGGNKKK